MKNLFALFICSIIFCSICNAGIDGPVFELKTMGMDVSLDEISTWIGPVVIDEYTFEFYDKINPNIMVRCQMSEWESTKPEIRERLKMSEKDYYCDYRLIQKYRGPMGGLATIYAIYKSPYMQAPAVEMYFAKIIDRDLEMQWAYHENFIPGKIEPPAPPTSVEEWYYPMTENNKATVVFQVKQAPPMP